MKKPKKEVLETIEDDIQIKIDNFFDRLTAFVHKEARQLKEEGIRAVCVDHAHVDAKFIQNSYDDLMTKGFGKDNVKFYLDEWLKSLLH